MSKMEFVFKNKGTAATNNPDDIPQLQALSRPALTPDPKPKPNADPNPKPNPNPNPDPDH